MLEDARLRRCRRRQQRAGDRALPAPGRPAAERADPRGRLGGEADRPRHRPLRHDPAPLHHDRRRARRRPAVPDPEVQAGHRRRTAGRRRRQAEAGADPTRRCGRGRRSTATTRSSGTATAATSCGSRSATAAASCSSRRPPRCAECGSFDMGYVVASRQGHALLATSPSTTRRCRASATRVGRAGRARGGPADGRQHRRAAARAARDRHAARGRLARQPPGARRGRDRLARPDHAAAVPARPTPDAPYRRPARRATSATATRCRCGCCRSRRR